MMTEQTESPTPETPTNDDGGQPPRKRCRRRRRGRYVLGVLALAVAAGVGIGAVVKHNAWAGWHDGSRFEEMIDHKLDHVLDEVDATDEQRAKIRPILLDASEDMRTFYLEMRGSREAFVAALSGTVIDRQSIEALRVERLASMDQASQRMLAALANAVEVLTPEQRTELAERLARHSHRHD
jgi:Spy/CpxP family protein refolding chaperone